MLWSSKKKSDEVADLRALCLHANIAGGSPLVTVLAAQPPAYPANFASDVLTFQDDQATAIEQPTVQVRNPHCSTRFLTTYERRCSSGSVALVALANQVVEFASEPDEVGARVESALCTPYMLAIW